MVEEVPLGRFIGCWHHSNSVLVRKRKGKLRMCVDYRMLNKRIIKDAYALPRIEELLHGAKYFSTVDMKARYHQIQVEESHRERTAFTSRTIRIL